MQAVFGNRIVKRGEIYYTSIRSGYGSEQNGNRPVLIIQNKNGHDNDSTVIVASITSAQKSKVLPIHFDIKKEISFLSKDSTVLLEQLKAMDIGHLANKVSMLDDWVMERITKRIEVSLGIAMPKESGSVVRRNDIYLANFGNAYDEPIISPVLVIQNDVGNMHSPTTIVAAIVPWLCDLQNPTHLRINQETSLLGQDATILFEQINTIDKIRLIKKISQIDDATADMVNKKIRTCLCCA